MNNGNHLQIMVIKGEQFSYIPRACRFWSSPGISPETKSVSPLVLYQRHPHWSRLHYKTIFADDTIACLLIKSNSDALNMQRDLDKLAQWEHMVFSIILWFLFTGKGGKNRRRGKNENENEKRELVFKEDGQGIFPHFTICLFCCKNI
jgi:hypothetical protein